MQRAEIPDSINAKNIMGQALGRWGLGLHVWRCVHAEEMSGAGVLSEKPEDIHDKDCKWKVARRLTWDGANQCRLLGMAHLLVGTAVTVVTG